MQNKTMNGIFQNCLKLFVRKTLSVTNRYVVHLQKIHKHLLRLALGFVFMAHPSTFVRVYEQKIQTQ